MKNNEINVSIPFLFRKSPIRYKKMVSMAMLLVGDLKWIHIMDSMYQIPMRVIQFQML